MLQAVYEMLLSLPYCELNSSTRCANCVISTSFVWLIWLSYNCSKSSLVMVDDKRCLAFELVPISSSIDDVDDEDDVEMVRSNSLLMLLNIFSHYRRIADAIAVDNERRRRSGRDGAKPHRIWIDRLYGQHASFLQCFNCVLLLIHFNIHTVYVFSGLLFFCTFLRVRVIGFVFVFFSLCRLYTLFVLLARIYAWNVVHQTHKQKPFVLLSNCSQCLFWHWRFYRVASYSL